MYMSTLFTLITDKSVFRFIYKELESKVIVWLMKRKQQEYQFSLVK